MRPSWLTSWACVMLLAETLGAGGCGTDQSKSDRSPPSASPTKPASADAGTANHPQVSAARGNDRIVSATPRRVIYTADVLMQTRDFAKAERTIPDLVHQVGGYLTEISLNRQQGEQRSGRWQARIPAEHFHEFLEGLDEIGVPDRRQVTGQDVTEEYVDLETRLANKKRL